MHVLTKTLVSIHNQFGYSSIQYFDWFLDDCLASFGRKITNPPPESCIPVLFELGKQYAEMVIEADPFSDLLGLVYMELGSEYGKKRMGQFFTPDAVSTMCAEMTAPYSLTEPDRLHTLLEPASGAGSMLLVYVRVWLSRFHRVDNLGVYAVDLDSLCARMTALQLLSNCLVHLMIWVKSWSTRAMPWQTLIVGAGLFWPPSPLTLSARMSAYLQSRLN